MGKKLLRGGAYLARAAARQWRSAKIIAKGKRKRARRWAEQQPLRCPAGGGDTTAAQRTRGRGGSGERHPPTRSPTSSGSPPAVTTTIHAAMLNRRGGEHWEAGAAHQQYARRGARGKEAGAPFVVNSTITSSLFW